MGAAAPASMRVGGRRVLQALDFAPCTPPLAGRGRRVDPHPFLDAQPDLSRARPPGQRVALQHQQAGLVSQYDIEYDMGELRTALCTTENPFYPNC